MSRSIVIALFNVNTPEFYSILSALPRSVLVISCFQGSCAGLEFKAGLEKSLNFRKLKMALNCSGKRMEGLEKFGICLS